MVTALAWPVDHSERALRWVMAPVRQDRGRVCACVRTDAVDAVLGLQHGGRCPVELGEDDDAGSRQRDARAAWGGGTPCTQEEVGVGGKQSGRRRRPHTSSD